MPLGFGSIKDIAKEIRGPLWLIAVCAAVFLLCCGWAVVRCGG